MSWFRRRGNVRDGAVEFNHPYKTVDPDKVWDCADQEIAQSIRLRSGASSRLRKVLGGVQSFRMSPVKMLGSREANSTGRGRLSSADCCHMLSRYLPVSGPSVIDNIQNPAYVSQFSGDGSFFVAGFKEGHIKIYDVDRGWKVQKSIRTRRLSWTITDTSLSPDLCLLVYATISPVVHVVNTGSTTTESDANISEIHEGLDFSLNGDDYDDYSFGIFSVKFSTDGQELVAGCSDGSLCVYDLKANEVALRIPAHTYDVNAVCFSDETGHLIYSGSDDNLCKVWDRRCLGSRGQAAGVLMGHVEGITSIDSRGDGRYFISNGKDQVIKLWDIRKMSTNVDYKSPTRDNHWDYRWMEYPNDARVLRLRDDLSLATYKGHTVLGTLIRCYFSPLYSTGQQYIYTGSADSSIYIYDLVSSEQVARLDFHDSTVRDCSWHPFSPMLVSSSFDGSVAVWEFPGKGEQPPPKRSTRRIRRIRMRPY